MDEIWFFYSQKQWWLTWVKSEYFVISKFENDYIIIRRAINLFKASECHGYVMYIFDRPVPLTLSSCESGCSRLCCWIAIGGGRGTASAPSSPSSSPQLCMPDEEDLDRVPLLRPSLRMRYRQKWKSDCQILNNTISMPHSQPNSSRCYLLQSFILWSGGTVVWVLLWAGHHVHVLPCAVAVLLVLVGEFLDVTISFTGAKPPYRACQPLSQSIPGTFGSWWAVRTQGLAGARLQSIITGYRQGV